MVVNPAGGGVQSLDRAFAVLDAVADLGGTARLSELAARTGYPLPTIHRLARSLVSAGYLRQEPSKRYSLGPRLIRLGSQAAHMLGSWATPHLSELAARTGETANLAVLEGDEVVYVAQVPGAHSVRMFTEVGTHAPAHGTGVGKALLSQLDDEEVRRLVGRTGLPAATPRTITTTERLLADLADVRERGYAIDDGERETGVRCVAVPLSGGPRLVAMSVSGPSSRVTFERIGDVLPPLRAAAAALTAELDGS
jgi:IclR family transcriptional regulator, acetate operon repressor